MQLPAEHVPFEKYVEPTHLSSHATPAQRSACGGSLVSQFCTTLYPAGTSHGVGNSMHTPPWETAYVITCAHWFPPPGVCPCCWTHPAAKMNIKAIAARIFCMNQLRFKCLN